MSLRNLLLLPGTSLPTTVAQRSPDTTLSLNHVTLSCGLKLTRLLVSTRNSVLLDSIRVSCTSSESTLRIRLECLVLLDHLKMSAAATQSTHQATLRLSLLPNLPSLSDGRSRHMMADLNLQDTTSRRPPVTDTDLLESTSETFPTAITRLTA